ncbi:MAG: hypothetical protein ACRERR_10880 [Moraxellaceae bacterium]
MSRHSRTTQAIAITLSAWLVIGPTVLAMQPLADSELSEQNGAGLAFPFENFRFEMEKTSFIQLTGSDTSLCTSGTNTPAGCTTFRRSDIRYYGLSISRGTTGGASGTVTTSNVTDWYGNGCTAGTYGLGCPLSSDGILNYSNFDNPFLLRVFNYTGYDTAGNSVSDRPVLEILGPSNMDAFRWSFFGEVESGRTYGAKVNGMAPITGATCGVGGALSGSACLLQLQNTILGKPASRLKPYSVDTSDTTNPWYGPALRLFQYAGTTADTGANPATYGIQYESRLSGNYRMSVNSSAASPVRGVAPDFSDEEGLYFMNVQAYLPLGQLHYQSLVFDDTQAGSTGAVTTNGNISIEVSRIPNVANVYKDFYSFADGTTGSANSGYARTGRSTRYYQTHGYTEWGSAFPTNANPNGLGGTGVSTVKYSGIDIDGVTRTINAANFPAPTYFTSGRPGIVAGDAPVAPNCNGPSYCTYLSATVGDVFSAPTTTRDNVIAAGGIVFVSKDSSSTWDVLQNQNNPETPLNMLWVNNTSGNGGGGNWASTYRLERDGRYSAAGVSNPMLKVNAINLGTARIDGLTMNHMKIETLGGQ